MASVNEQILILSLENVLNQNQSSTDRLEHGGNGGDKTDCYSESLTEFFPFH